MADDGDADADADADGEASLPADRRRVLAAMAPAVCPSQPAELPEWPELSELRTTSAHSSTRATSRRSRAPPLNFSAATLTCERPQHRLSSRGRLLCDAMRLPNIVTLVWQPPVISY